MEDIVYIPLDVKMYNLNPQNYVISSVRVKLLGVHAVLAIWNRTGYAGVLTVLAKDIPAFLNAHNLVPE